MMESFTLVQFCVAAACSTPASSYLVQSVGVDMKCKLHHVCLFKTIRALLRSLTLPGFSVSRSQTFLHTVGGKKHYLTC